MEYFAIFTQTCIFSLFCGVFFFCFQKQLDLFFSILSELLQGTLKDLLKFWLETFLSINIQVFLPLTYSVKMGHVEKNFFHNYLLSWLSTMLSMTCVWGNICYLRLWYKK